ncbi:MAG: hypothetical protein QM742_11135 [Aquabacterium sp.]
MPVEAVCLVQEEGAHAEERLAQGGQPQVERPDADADEIVDPVLHGGCVIKAGA